MNYLSLIIGFILGTIASFFAAILYLLVLNRIKPLMGILLHRSPKSYYPLMTRIELSNWPSPSTYYERIHQWLKKITMQRDMVLDLGISVSLTGKQKQEFNPTLGRKFFVKIPLADDGAYPILYDYLEFELRLDKVEFWEAVENQLSDTSMKKDIQEFRTELAKLLQQREKIGNRSRKQKIERTIINNILDNFRRLFSIYDGLYIVVNYQDPRTGFRQTQYETYMSDQVEAILFKKDFHEET